ncbi:MAG: plasmid pRiA4b ORF-3 family protein [Desulfobulbaceae bacterium]|jgi:hypothetical protein|nr:plasmid pRiA4b ORF-3 family protein [Desulfobulbaceae bacterium]
MATIIQLPKSSRNEGGVHRKKADEPVIRCRLMIRLAFADMPFWRRLEVPGRYSLFNLHQAIQVVMGWDDRAAHQFMVGKMLYRTFAGRPLRLDESQYDERQARLQSLTKQMRFIFQYIYDVDNSWECGIELEELKELPPGTPLEPATLLAGQGKFPDEDIADAYALDAYCQAHPQTATVLTAAEIDAINDSLRQL